MFPKFALAALCLTASWTVAQAPADFKPDQAVEVREGDEWSAATVVKKEGRKIQIKYGDGTDEWVTADRIRTPQAKAGDAKAGDAKAADPKAPAKVEKPVRTQWQLGQTVQVKWGGMWRDAKINNKRVGDWYLVTYDKGPFQEWVEWYRIRKAGSTDDSIPYASPNGGYRKGEDPPRPDAGDAPVEKRGGGREEKQPFDKPLTDADANSGREVLATFSGAWAVAPDPDPTKVASPQPIPLKSKGDHMRTQYLLRCGQAMALVMIDSWGSDTKGITFEKIDLAAGTSSAPVSFHVQSSPIAISPSGKRVLGRSNVWGFGGRKRLDLWTLETSDLQHVISFSPYVGKPGDSSPDTDIETAAFITDDIAYTTNRQGILIAWDVAKAKALWCCNFGRKAEVALSPGRKYLYCTTSEDELLCLDAATGKPLGSIEGGRPITGDIGVSPDGTRLVGVSSGLVSIYDLQAGKVVGDIGLGPKVNSGNVNLLSDGYALINSATLFDLNKRVAIWNYTGAVKDTTVCIGGRVFAVLDETNRKVLVNAMLPHDAAKKAADIIDADNQLLLKPGGKVALDIAVAAKPEEIQQIIRSFTEQLQKNGITIDQGAPIRIVARTEDGKTTQETWGTMGGAPWNRQQETVNITEKITRVAVETDGKVAWETRTVNRPFGMVRAEAGQSIGQAVGAANQFNTAFFKSVRLPQYVMRPTETTGFGQSRWALGGVKDAK